MNGRLIYVDIIIAHFFSNAGMYVGEEEGVRGEKCGEEEGGDETRGLGFFEGHESPSEGDDGVKRKTKTSATSPVKV